MKLKILLILIPLICFICVAVAFIVYHVSDTGGLEYTLNEDEQSYTVSGIGTADNVFTLKIPKTHDGKPVTAIGKSAFANCKNITKVKIPESVTFIGDHAFDNCASLVDIVFANTTGWSAGENIIANNLLTNTEQAANLVQYTYCAYSWHRS